MSRSSLRVTRYALTDKSGGLFVPIPAQTIREARRSLRRWQLESSVTLYLRRWSAASESWILVR